MKAVKVLGFSFMFFALLTSAFADTIAGNLGAGNTYSNMVYGVPGANNSALAVGFTPSENFMLSQILIALATGVNPPYTADAYVVLSDTDTNGLPGTALYQWFITSLPAVDQFNLIQSSQTLTPSGSVPLMVGRTYWIVAIPYSPNTADFWNVDSTDDSVGSGGLLAYSTTSGWNLATTSYDDLPAFEVDGVPAPLSSAPEPSEFLLLGTGLLVLGWLGLSRRARRCA